jgi:hypothetical protein
VVPLQDLVQENAIDEAAEGEAENAGGNEWPSSFGRGLSVRGHRDLDPFLGDEQQSLT